MQTDAPPPPQDGRNAEHLKMVPNTLNTSLYWVVFDRFMPQNWSKGVFKMVCKIQKSAQKGSLRVFLRGPQRNSWAFGSGEFFFSAECDNELGLASPCMPTCPLEVIFSRIIPIFLARVGGVGGGCLLSSGPAHWSLWVSEALRQNTTRES